MILLSAPLYLYHDDYCTINPDGEITLMTPARFVTWVESHIAFSRGKSLHSMSSMMARQILEADVFRVQIRKLNAVSEVRLPVWRGEGDARTVELAPEGYDSSTGIYTLNSIPYPADVSSKEAYFSLWQILKDFPFALEGATAIHECRSFSAHLSAMLGDFCAFLLPEGTPRPMIVYTSNRHATGKSLLLSMALAPVHGPLAKSVKPKTDGEFEKVLDSVTLSRKPNLVLDDCESIESDALKRFLTSPVHECRKLHSQQLAIIPKITQVWASGNRLRLSEDLARRSVLVELLENQKEGTRKIDKPMSPSWLYKAETRAKFLSYLWAFVRSWRDQGMPPLPEHRRDGFEDWTNLIGGIVMTGSFHNPFAPPQRGLVNDDDPTTSLIHVLGTLVGDASIEQPPLITSEQILDRSAELQLLEDIVGTRMECKSLLSRLLIKLRGRILVDIKGRSYKSSNVPTKKGQTLIIDFLSDAPSDG